MPQLVQRLMQSGVDYFGVANVHEAAEIRHMGAGWPILILSPVLPEEDRYLIDYDLIPTLSTLAEARRLNDLGQRNKRAIKVHVKIDTGMGRLGIWHTEALPFIQEILAMTGLEITGIYTHFSSADTDPEFTRLQRERFVALLNEFKRLALIRLEDLLIHADNSSSLNSLTGDTHFNAVRVGLLQLGIPPYPKSVLGKVQVEPVFSFYTKIGMIKNLPADTDISYSRTHRLNKATRVAVLTAGYGDGIPLKLSNKGHVLIQGIRCPIIGRVTMDQTIIDLSPVDHAEVGDTVVLIGQQGESQITTKAFSDTAESIPWETLCSITKRVARVYVGSREL